MKKRTLALLLACSLCLSLAACGKKDPDPTGNVENSPEQSQDQPTTPSEPATV